MEEQTSNPKGYVIIYIRQSTPEQELKNLGSAATQLQLTEVALQLGWAEGQIRVVKESGRSATIGDTRPGFLSMLNEIESGLVRIVFYSDPSRLSRNDLDWARFKEACRRNHTSVYDDGKILDLHNPFDAIHLNMQHLRAITDTDILRFKLNVTKTFKLKSGQMRFALPVGYERDHNGGTIRTENEDVRRTIEDVFRLFSQLRSLIAVAANMDQNKLKIPVRSTQKGYSISWVRPSSDIIGRIINNPCYAGVYAYFKSKSTRYRNSDGDTKKHTMKVNLEEWRIKLLDHHEAYITWDEYLENQSILRENRFGNLPGAARDGAALLQGLTRCGVCGNAMHVYYESKNGGRSIYRCDEEKKKRGAPLCQSLTGPPIEEAVIHNLLIALSPIDISIGGNIEKSRIEGQKRLFSAWERNLKILTREVENAEKRLFNAIDQNLTGITLKQLEINWLKLNEELIELRMHRPAIADENAALCLAANITELWNGLYVHPKQRKLILRSVVDYIELKKDIRARKVWIVIHWIGGSLTCIVLSHEQYRFRKTILDSTEDVVRRMAPTHPTADIVKALKSSGVKTRKGTDHTVVTVDHIISRLGLNKNRRFLQNSNIRMDDLPKDCYLIADAAKLLQTSKSTIKKLFKQAELGNSRIRDRVVYIPANKIDSLRQEFINMHIDSATEDDEKSFFSERLNDLQWQELKQHLINKGYGEIDLTTPQNEA